MGATGAGERSQSSASKYSSSPSWQNETLFRRGGCALLEVGDADPDPLGVPLTLLSGGVYGGVTFRQLFMVARVDGCVPREGL